MCPGPVCSIPSSETGIIVSCHSDGFSSAGSQDSPLTSHGAIQSNQLGVHLTGPAASPGSAPYIFCSDFQQAVITAETIRDAYQLSAAGPISTTVNSGIEIIPLGELREKRFGKRNADVSDSATTQPEGPSYTEREPPEEVDARAKRLLDAVLLPLLDGFLTSNAPQYVFIVAHAGILSHVWLQFIRLLRALYLRMPLALGALRLGSVPLDEFLGNAA